MNMAEELKNKIAEIHYSEWKFNKEYDMTLDNFIHAPKQKARESDSNEYYVFDGHYNQSYDDISVNKNKKVKIWIPVVAFNREIIRHYDFKDDPYDVSMIMIRLSKKKLKIKSFKEGLT